MRALRFLLALTLVVGLAEGASAQDPADYTVRFSDDAAGAQGAEADIIAVMDVASGAIPVAGWGWGVCQDSLIDIVSLEDGATTIMLAPAFNAPQILPGEGWTVGVVIDFFGMIFLNPSDDNELHVATYSILGAAGPATVNYCDNLGSPPVETVLVVEGGGSVAPTQLPGNIEIVTTPPYLIKAGDAIGAPGEVVSIPVNLDTDSATSQGPAEGFAFGITHDPALAALNDITPGAVVEAANGGAGPDFFGVDVTPDGGTGGTVGCAISLDLPFDTIPELFDQEIALLSYSVAAGAPDGAIASLDFTDSLGMPMVLVQLSIGGFPVIPDSESGSIEVQGMPVTVFRRGDANNDSGIDVADVVYLAKALFGVGPTITCDDAGDTDDNGVLEPLIDTFYLLNFLFQDGPPVPVPFPNCGGDPTMDALECDDYAGSC